MGSRLSIAAIFLLFSLVGNISAQAPPQGISYQAVARNDDGSILAESDLSVRISLLANGSTGTLVWEEIHDVVTDQYGLFSLVIGQGEFTGGNAPSFDLINWGVATYFLQVELDPGDGIFELMGVSQMLSVPYAFYAETSGGDDDPDPTNELIDLVTLVDDSLLISEGGVDHYLDLGEAVGSVPTDECITLVQLSENNLNIVECGEAYVVDLSPLIDDGDWVVGDGTVYNEESFVGIGTSNPTSHLRVSGSVAYQVSVFSAPGNILMDENVHVVVVDLSNNDFTLTLPPAADCMGRQYTIKIISDNTLNDLNLVTNGTETIDLQDDVVISGVDNMALSIISDGNNWWVINGTINP